LYARHPKPPLARVVKGLVEWMAIQALPDTQYHAPAVTQDTVHFSEGGLRVGEEHQSKLAQDQVKVAIGGHELLSLSLTPFNIQTLPFSRSTSYIEHIRIEIETNDFSMQSNVWRNVPGDDTCPARHVEDTLARSRIRRLNQVS
jgi:hypothetical protein